MRRGLVAAVLVAGVASCGGPAPRQYELRGQVVAVDRTKGALTIKHEDIPGFMPGMTMPFRVKDPKLLERRVPGDVVTATLVVEEADAYLTAVTKTGAAAVPTSPPLPPAFGVEILKVQAPARPAPAIPAFRAVRAASRWATGSTRPTRFRASAATRSS